MYEGAANSGSMEVYMPRLIIVKGNFGEAEMRQWWNEKDYIGFIRETVLTEEMSLADTVQKILSDI